MHQQPFQRAQHAGRCADALRIQHAQIHQMCAGCNAAIRAAHQRTVARRDSCDMRAVSIGIIGAAFAREIFAVHHAAAETAFRRRFQKHLVIRLDTRIHDGNADPGAIDGSRFGAVTADDGHGIYARGRRDVTKRPELIVARDVIHFAEGSELFDFARRDFKRINVEVGKELFAFEFIAIH